ncbi:Na+/H+ antiporter subunit D [Frankia sp. CNm7]|uniref:Na+/H+ antiporter subunit D n=1 Tax=Frankia nepalensis TaxID=1836974 RepID=A0A937UPB7_9ACTN|nr:Na+/H+ antiporter subunit D [Frankia nepalensis]MBL7495785.1 Na+/H+ antiporter subunit D [Frankia nepalensis]MBL7516132.1 Na+/H+ antiporter subunit D [Frankia nepalensis]MBL7524945.1 Na+/H+ antiporter subunit D [Frankia nepalensis]MBL7627105.1 Na+/H+ antiporter subunit D [Frankia nepalensis]
MSILVVLPMIAPLLAAGVILVLRRHPRAQRLLALAVIGAMAADSAALVVLTDTGGPIAANLGGWPAPIGVTLVADRLSALLLLVSDVVTFAVFCYAVGQGATRDTSRGDNTIFTAVYLCLVAGVALAYLTADLFNLFVAFELMLVSSYVLITLGTTASRIRAGMTYVIVSLTSSLLFLTMIALVYAATGTVNLADLAREVGGLPDGLRAALGLLVLVVFGIKAAAVPLHFWLPDSYPTAPAPITAVLAALLTKVGVYALIRTHTLVFSHDGTWLLLLGVAVLTLLVGALGAIAQEDLNRMLSFLLVSHIGYMLFGLSLFTAIGLSGVILYMVHHILTQATLFLVGGLVAGYAGTSVPRRAGGLAAAAPVVAVLFAVPALSLAGVPPLSGFVAKLALLQAGSRAGGVAAYLAIAAMLAASLLTLYAMVRVWVFAFWRRPRPASPDPEPPGAAPANPATVRRPMIAATAGLVAAGVALTVFAGPLAGLTGRAAEDVLRPTVYQDVVLPAAGAGGGR